MGSRYLTDLASVCRGAGLNVTEVDGWQTRARGSGGYDPGRPTHVMVHHTASSTSPINDVNYCCYGADAKPLANILLDRTGLIWVMAAGATNTNGSGTDSWGGGVPTDSMNTYAIGIEAANNGTGESWPQVQQDAYVKLCQTLCRAYGIPNNQVRGHCEWAPGRKIDPAGPSAWASGKNTWNMTGFRNSCNTTPPEPQPPDPTPTPEPEDDDMTGFIISNTGDGQVALIYGDGRMIGLAGPDLPGYYKRFGDPIPTDPSIWNAFSQKQP